MKTGRDKKVAGEILRAMSQILYFELGDPRLSGVSVTQVKMTKDLRLARVYYCLPGAVERKEEVTQAFKKASGRVRHLLSQHIRMKYLPQLDFFYDESLEIQEKISQLFPEKIDEE
ncbi:MAG: 30S ribosome-binding factor RbfA [Deltaproteobacteria bacterium]|nr:30S ribosome-binding factor RbfA [Deltaproteobacteria bacterium]